MPSHSYSSRFLGDGHVLIEDFPGLAKTLTARSFAQVLDIEFSRIQFTPDLMPSDVTGSSIYNQRSGDFEFRRGPIFTNLLLGDEINRAPPKTQAALLEAMQERQVTIEGETIRLDAPFLVIATQNPIEYEGTYPLPEAQLDRFLLRVNFGYPSRDDEWTLLERRLERATDEIQLDAVIDRRRTRRDAGGNRASARDRADREVRRRHRDWDTNEPASPGWCKSTWLAGVAQALPVQGGARRP